MKRRYVVRSVLMNGHVLIGRANNVPIRARRQPPETPVCYLEPDEVRFTPTGKPTLAFAGRFRAFRPSALQYRTVMDRELIADWKRRAMTEVINWIAEADEPWSIDIRGERLVAEQRVYYRLEPEFSFAEPGLAVEFKLKFG